MSGNGWPTLHEVLSFYKLTYSSKRYCSGTVSMSGRGRSMVAKLPTSTVDWRITVCLAGGNWECDGGTELRKFVPRIFKPIGDKRYRLSSVEERRIARVLTTWPESTRNSYALNCWAVLEHVGLVRRPVKVDNDPRTKKMSQLGTEAQLLARLMEQARKSKRETAGVKEVPTEVSVEGAQEPVPVESDEDVTLRTRAT